jgi:hypothetical protein
VVHHSGAEALYYSGYAATTLGMGDVVADTPILRLVTVLEAFSGFALLTLSVTYLLGVYAARMDASVLAARIDSFFRGGVRSLDYGREEVRAALLRWAEPTTRQLLSVLQAHFQYPILHYFRAGDPRHSLTVQFRHLLTLHHLVEGGGAPREALARALDDPTMRALSRVARDYLEEVASLVPADTGGPDRTFDQLEETYRRLLEYLAHPVDAEG